MVRRDRPSKSTPCHYSVSLLNFINDNSKEVNSTKRLGCDSCAWNWSRKCGRITRRGKIRGNFPSPPRFPRINLNTSTDARNFLVRFVTMPWKVVGRDALFIVRHSTWLTSRARSWKFIWSARVNAKHTGGLSTSTMLFSLFEERGETETRVKWLFLAT